MYLRTINKVENVYEWDDLTPTQLEYIKNEVSMTIEENFGEDEPKVWNFHDLTNRLFDYMNNVGIDHVLLETEDHRTIWDIDKRLKEEIKFIILEMKVKGLVTLEN